MGDDDAAGEDDVWEAMEECAARDFVVGFLWWALVAVLIDDDAVC